MTFLGHVAPKHWQSVHLHAHSFHIQFPFRIFKSELQLSRQKKWNQNKIGPYNISIFSFNQKQMPRVLLRMQLLRYQIFIPYCLVRSIVWRYAVLSCFNVLG